MRLTTHTDYGLRLLMLSADASPEAVSISAVASQLNVSRNHLMKVAQNLAKAGLLEPVRGRSGGFRLAKPAHDIRVGDAVRTLECETALVECMREAVSGCPLVGGCRLPSLFRRATAAFFHILDGSTLDDLMRGNSQILKLVEAR
ncbi:MAG: Rrf2 family transcriptional regulator [Fimbriimonadaceae bacterium]|nr:Rrf2 family transcriptional regulator [Fimbriimonadaceae bacterium]